MTMWFNLMTFDVIGELAFGESFKALDNGQTHFWVGVFLASMGQACLSETLKRFPFLGMIYTNLNPGWLSGLVESFVKHESYTIEVMKKWAWQSKMEPQMVDHNLCRRINQKLTEEILWPLFSTQLTGKQI